MKSLFKSISLITALFAFDQLSAAESLYASNVQARLADSDKDGVIDARDLCPDTPLGVAVDNDGCPFESTKLLSIELKVLFDSGKADIKPRFYSELKELAKFLQDNPTSNVVIEGHTDSQGSAELNLALSQRRATAIADVLVDSFRIKADRVKGIGYGATRPIADNDTAAGRQMNRRVVAEVFAKQKFANERWTIYSVDQNASTALNKN
ncbi:MULTISPECIES: OmpA family protein [Marinomonas]|uniref:Outer membrane protein OmpA-like peptidoglycan-associated protein n=1 Tax=Marinomonas alcarazii TaxID=491949 RepID=A0A318V765_9GAMM|nr:MULTISPECIES: OmpA family protein [Marinomonas]PYF84526.1 outer membrane protein OmpA-like peptidoglycan-associated protein [Marinomonas alcarazii]